MATNRERSGAVPKNADNTTADRTHDALDDEVTRARRMLREDQIATLAKALAAGIDAEVARRAGLSTPLPDGLALAGRVATLARIFGRADAPPAERKALKAAHQVLMGAEGKVLARGSRALATFLTEHTERDEETLRTLLVDLEPYDPAFGRAWRGRDLSRARAAFARYRPQGGKGAVGSDQLLAILVVSSGAFGEGPNPGWTPAIERVVKRVRDGRKNSRTR